MRSLKRASDALFLFALVLVVLAIVKAVKVLLLLAAAALVASVGFTMAKRAKDRARRQT